MVGVHGDARGVYGHGGGVSWPKIRVHGDENGFMALGGIHRRRYIVTEGLSGHGRDA